MYNFKATNVYGFSVFLEHIIVTFYIFCLAKVCSLHFSEDSFIVPKRKSKIAKKKTILHLLRSAVPTLFLTPAEDRTNTMENMDFKIIRREFPLVCNPDTSRDENVESSSGIDAVSQSCDDSIAVTPTVCSTSNPWLNESFRVTRTPPSALHTLGTDFSKTFPRRSLRCMPYTYHRRTSASRKHEHRGKVQK
ncbi:hypothetical protein ALC57_15105 [Trachymyrmex cornetzi]|uniref:THAP-type domain-containing protein n=1 Tax=Trachymyrmex cornetzi TaxID=471704 RepID=A0A151IXG0_9HYME|nr:hypothetical protein ALC57_15105 [Trachymyrmex cornetzi]